MEVPYSSQIDMWSLACILYELHTTQVLFKSHQKENNNKFTQLEKIMEVLGELTPKGMVESSPYAQDLRALLEK